MGENDYKAIINSIDQALRVFEQQSQRTGFEVRAYEKLKTLRASVVQAQRNVAEGNPDKSLDEAAGR